MRFGEGNPDGCLNRSGDERLQCGRIVLEERKMRVTKQAIGCLFAFLPVLWWSVAARAAVVGKSVEYRQGETVLVGYLAYDDADVKPRPGVLVVPEWWGLNDFAKKRADELAKLGTIAFAVDMYGKGQVAKTREEAAALAGPLRSDRALMRARALAGLEVLKGARLTDTARLAAIGFCFGGTTVLELARAGTPLAGVVSFHGGLSTPMPAGVDGIKAKVLVLHGADDPNVPAAEVSAFQEEMRNANADWQMIFYGGAVHSFTNPDAGNDPKKGVAYNEKAARRSWEAMKTFFAEVFR